MANVINVADIDKTLDEIEEFRKRGMDVTDLVITKGGYGKYRVRGTAGYLVEIDFVDRKWRHCGYGPGCFWTEWEPY